MHRLIRWMLVSWTACASTAALAGSHNLPGMGTANAGLALTLGGSSFATLGAFAGSTGITLAGAGVGLVGQPMMAGGSMHAARELQARGYHVSRVGGGVAWAGIGLEGIGPLTELTGGDVGTVLTAIGSTTAFLGGASQMIVDSAIFHSRDGKGGLDDESEVGGSPPIPWASLAPLPLPQGAGLALVGAF